MKRSLRAAFSLIEVTIALGLATFCLTAIFGLLPVGLNSNLAASNETTATGILAAVSADLLATPSPSSTSSVTSQQFSIIIPANPVTSPPATQTLYFTSHGQSSISLQTQSRYLLTVNFLTNVLASGSSGKAATLVSLQVSWPAAVALPNAGGSVKTFIALDRN